MSCNDNNVSTDYKCYAEQNEVEAKAHDIIPTDPRLVLSVMLGDQDKFNLVMENLIEILDKAEEQQKKKQSKKKVIEVAAIT